MKHRQQPTEKGFWPFIILQAQGAFSDNVFKQTLILLVATTFALQASQTALAPGAAGQANYGREGVWNGYISFLFSVPFLFFSVWAGFLADKYSKRTITLITKGAEFLIMTIGLFILSMKNYDAMLGYGLGVLFLMGSHSAFFSPSKYGIIPEIVPVERLSWANGILELFTFLSIILGTAVAGELFQLFGPGHLNKLYYVSLVLMALAVVGFIAGLGIKHTPPANPTRRFEWNFLPEMKRYFGILRSDRKLFLTVLGLAYFWGLGSMLLVYVNIWGMSALNLEIVPAGRLVVVLALGIGIGSALAGYLSGDHIELGLTPLGGLGMALFTLPMALATPDNRLFMILCLFMLGISAGFYSVPLNAILQRFTDIKDRGGLLAANNIVTFSAMMLAAVLLAAANKLFAPDPRVIMLACSVITLIGTIVLLRLLPEALLRFVAILLTSSIYRIKTQGRNNIPKEGGALLVSNHVSFIDALLIMAVCPRPIRFIVFKDIYEKKGLHFFLKIMRAIPVSSAQRPRELLTSLKEAAKALQNGELVCIFAEGEITRTGMMLPVRRGYEYILKETPAPVIPICLHGVWGSIFSFKGHKFFWKMPSQLPYHLRIHFGQPLPSTVEPAELRQVMEELGADAAIAAKDRMPLLHHQWIQAARRNWRQVAMVDTLSPPITMGQSLWRSIILARRLAAEWGRQETVGIMLPPSVGGALANFAAALSGRTVVNLNYTTGQAVLESCIRRTKIETIITARQFAKQIEEKMGLTIPDGIKPIYIEEYRGFKGFAEVFASMAAALVFPPRMVEIFCKAVRRPGSDSLAAIIFSSGSTGDPKGIMLSHFNVAANVVGFSQAIRIWPHDRMLGTLPFFHSFGYTVTLWGAVTVPFGMVYHLSPLDIKTIGELCEKHKISIIITTPTFLQGYLHKITPPQFGGLNTVVTGAEKLSDKLRMAFLEKFGVEPLQGYGTTECAPAVAVNVDDFRSPGFHQVGHKRGSIGHPIPGVAVRVVNIDTGAPQPVGQPGLLLVRGPNIMQGYMDMPEKTADVLKDGWYNTGDVAYIDEDGFIFITDRLSRFSKIGGEMVPHVTVEEKLHEVLGLNEPSMIVTAVPDETKGEKLVVLHTVEAEKLDGYNEKLAAAGLSNLWIPRRDSFYKIEQIPVLGSGKLDLQKVKQLALELAGK